MSILFGFFTPIVLFLITLPLKASIKVVEKKLNDKKKEEKSNNKRSKNPVDLIRSKVSNKDIKNKKSTDKKNKMSVKAMQLLLRSLQALKVFLTALKSAVLLLISCLSLFTIFILVIILLLVVLLVCVINSDSSSGWLTGSSVTSSSSQYVSSPVSADVNEIINMSESEVWKLISEGRFSSYSEANSAAQGGDENYNREKEFWEGLLVQVEVPVWKWTDNTKSSKTEGTITITVNKYVADYWKSFMTELHSCPEKYVIYYAGGQNFRTKNNGTGTSNLSAHSFGVVLDINTSTKGMGSNAAGLGDGTPWNSDNGLSEPYKSEACAFSGNWFNLVKKYRLDWGGLWSSRMLDPMHFSIVGDNNRDTRNYQPKSSGQNPK